MFGRYSNLNLPRGSGLGILPNLIPKPQVRNWVWKVREPDHGQSTLNELIDISSHQLRELKNSTAADPDDNSDNHTDEEDSPLDSLDGNED